jgi:insulysin
MSDGKSGSAEQKAGSSSGAALTPAKSAQDKRDYRIITLSNKLTAVLIHDKECDKAAAAMDVNVGHFSDANEAPGLAHFCEHMLFLGVRVRRGS